MTSALGRGRGTVQGGGIQIGQVPAVDVREPMTAQRGRPLSLLASLSNVQWAAPTAGLQWLVKDLARRPGKGLRPTGGQTEDPGRLVHGPCNFAVHSRTAR